MKNTIFLLLVILLTGCAGSVKEVKESYTHHKTYQFDENYQSVYRKLARITAECFTPGGQTNLYTDIKAGEIIFNNGGFGILFVIEIQGVEENLTIVDAYSSTFGWDKNVDRVYGWITGTRDGC